MAAMFFFVFHIFSGHESSLSLIRWAAKFYPCFSFYRAPAMRTRPSNAFCGILLLLPLAYAISLDFYRYAEEFRENGLVGSLGLPSLLIFQAGVFLGGVIFFALALHRHRAWWLRVMACLMGVAVALYCDSLIGIQSAARGGEFGLTVVGTLAVFEFFPSLLFLLVGLPVSILYLSRLDRKPTPNSALERTPTGVDARPESKVRPRQ